MSNTVLNLTSGADLGKMMDKDLSTALSNESEAKATIKQTAAVVLFSLRRLYGKDEETGEFHVSKFPVPGSIKKPGSNVLADKYPTQTTKADGTKGEGQGSWYVDFYDASPRGEQHKVMKEAHAALKDKAADSFIWDTEMKRINQIRTNEIGAIKNAVKLQRQLDRVNAEITDAFADIMLSPDGNHPARGSNIILLSGVPATKGVKNLTIGQFMALSVDKAIEIANGKEPTYAMLLNTTGRGAYDNKPKVNIKKPEDYDDVVAATGNYLDAVFSKTDSKEYKSFLTHLNSAGSDVLLLTMHDIMSKYETVLGMPGISKRVDDLLEQGGMKTAIERAKAAKAA